MSQRDKYRPDYLKLYPELADRPDILAVLQQTDRMMEYQEVDIKTGRFIQDQEKQIAKFLPSREDSVERLQEEEHRQFADESDMEYLVILREQIHCALLQLEEQDRELIEALFFSGLSERQYAKQIGAHYMTVHNRKVKVLAKLNKLLKK